MMASSDDVWAMEKGGKLKRIVCGGEMDTDQESVGSMEEMESPRSVAATAAKGRKWNYSYKNNIDVYVHSQILRIRAEDSHIGEDTPEIFSLKDKAAVSASGAGHLASTVVLIRPILPASPLGGNTTITT